MAGPLLPLDQMRQQVKRGLTVANKIVVDEIDRADDAALQQLVQLGDNLLRPLQARVAAVQPGNIAEFALIGAATGILDAAEEIMVDLGEFVSRNRKLGHCDAIAGFQHHLLRLPRTILRQPRNQVIGGVSQLADMQIVE